MSEEIKKTYIRMLSHTIHYDCCYNADADNDFEKISDYITNLQKKVEQLEKEIDRLNYIKSKATNYLIKAIKIDSEDDNCMCLERHEYKILLDMLLKKELKEE